MMEDDIQQILCLVFFFSRLIVSYVSSVPRGWGELSVMGKHPDLQYDMIYIFVRENVPPPPFFQFHKYLVEWGGGAAVFSTIQFNQDIPFLSSS